MATDGDYNQALASFMLKKTVAVPMSLDEWIAIPPDVRQRSFFMAGVSDRQIIERFRSSIEDFIDCRKGLNQIDKELHMWLREIGYKAPDGKEGTFDDLSSMKRIGFELNHNRDMAHGHADWVRAQTSIRTYPAQRFVRVSNNEESIDWDARWARAKADTSGVPGVHQTEKVALLNHPIWAALSRFGLPWPPFDFDSRMGVRGVKRAEALELGFKLLPDTDPMQQPIHRSMNEGLGVAPVY